MNFPLLSTLIFLPLVSSLFILIFKGQKNSYSAIYISLFGSIATFAAHNIYETKSAFDSTNGKIIIAYTNAADSQKGTAIVGTVSGTSISFGSATVFDSSDPRVLSWSSSLIVTIPSNSEYCFITGRAW